MVDLSIAKLRTLFDENRIEVERFLKFSIVGAVGTLIDFALLNFGILVLGLPMWLANAISFSVAVTNNFTWDRLWTYPESREKPFKDLLGQFLVVSIGGLIINETIFLSLAHFVFAPWGTWGYNLSKVIATGVVLFWNFGVNRLWTFKDVC